jgi:hypothetical protein
LIYLKKKNPYLDPSILGMYVGQFKKNKENIDKAVQEKNQNILRFVPDEILKSGKASDVLAYKSFDDLEKLIDGAFPFASGEKV